jgi:hypothetical protein
MKNCKNILELTKKYEELQRIKCSEILELRNKQRNLYDAPNKLFYIDEHPYMYNLTRSYLYYFDKLVFQGE